jgi:hypothetical protein
LLTLQGRYAFAQKPVALRAIFLLQRYEPLAAGQVDIAVQRFSPRAGVAALMAQTLLGALLRPDESARLLRLLARLVSQAPVCLLHYPHGFEYQDAIHARIMAELEAGFS